MVIKNLPDYARYHRYIVYRKCNGENWFWGAFDDEIKALNAAEEIGGHIYDQGGAIFYE